MKLLMFLVTGLCMTLFSCKKSDDVSATPTPIDSKAVMTVGSWSVNLYRQRTEDKTSSFKDMVFVFSPDGTVTVTQGNKSTKGTWVYSPAVVTYYGGTGVASLSFNLGTSKPFDLLNRSWNVNSESTSSTLKLDNKEPADDEHLIFVK